mmetsp:Transcript_13357/g.20137  ORF Transcript_13357/g.20137 Transcript_13357/m.20137 type:complete len:4168 (+) Transcript_13357:169-12672(+)
MKRRKRRTTNIKRNLKKIEILIIIGILILLTSNTIKEIKAAISCYGIDSGNPNVCGGRGTCDGADTCNCGTDYYGHKCQGAKVKQLGIITEATYANTGTNIYMMNNQTIYDREQFPMEAKEREGVYFETIQGEENFPGYWIYEEGITELGTYEVENGQYYVHTWLTHNESMNIVQTRINGVAGDAMDIHQRLALKANELYSESRLVSVTGGTLTVGIEVGTGQTAKIVGLLIYPQCSGFGTTCSLPFFCVNRLCYTTGSTGSCNDLSKKNCSTFCKVGYEGPRCDACSSGYYKASILCAACNCNPPGSVGIECTGNVCTCKSNYTGSKCGSCEDGYYATSGTHGVSATCGPCQCNLNGNSTAYCNKPDGVCTCKEGYTGDQCQDCAPGYKLTSGSIGNNPICEPCHCWTNGSASEECDKETGICPCKAGYTGNLCNNCLPNFYVTSGVQGTDAICTACDCYGTGSNPTPCDINTGQCDCKAGYDSLKCNTCVNDTHYAVSGVEGVNPNCFPCGCNPNGQTDGLCDASGVCGCKVGYEGNQCKSCDAERYASSGTEGVTPTCSLCQCNPHGNATQGCLVDGNCTCLSEYTGTYCKYCADGAKRTSGVTGVTPVCENCGCHGTGSNSLICNKETGVCSCKTEYEGTQCKSCKSSYFPSSGTEGVNPTCSPCNCRSNGRTGTSCTSSGVCDCQTGWAGSKCQNCAPTYYESGGTGSNPICSSCNCYATGSSTLNCDNDGKCTCNTGYATDKCNECADHYYDSAGSPGTPTCTSCGCNVNGLNGICDKNSGACPCKAGYTGTKCELCANGFKRTSGVHGTDPVCEPCNCWTTGSHNTVCDKLSGQCSCKANYQGLECRHCIPLTYALGGVHGVDPHCTACNCNHPAGASNADCEKNSGQCDCVGKYSGRTCSSCTSGNYKSSATECSPCPCNLLGNSTVCNPATGFCSCNAGYTGNHCDSCDADYYVTGAGPECTHCACNPNGFLTIGCDGSGTCSCKPGYGGNKCQNCLSEYYAHTGTHGVQPVCENCFCNEKGKTSGCNPTNGHCSCHANYTTNFCQECNTGFYTVEGVHGTDPKCHECFCNPNGKTGDCNPTNGHCPCDPLYTGDYCENCNTHAYLGIGSEGFSPTCIDCDCWPLGSVSSSCNGSGVCSCNEGYTSTKCRGCSNGYFASSGTHGTNPTCSTCQCNLRGNSSAYCNPANGICSCKTGYETPHCKSCEDQYYTVNGNHGVDPECGACNCYAGGRVNNVCNKLNGECNCNTGYTSDKCINCETEYFASSGVQGINPTCTFCNCNNNGSTAATCTDGTGSCACAAGYQNTKCNHCTNDHYASSGASGTSSVRCEDCKCYSKGSVVSSCDDITGQCQCETGYTGLKCNHCAPTYWAVNGTDGIDPTCIDCACHLPGTVGNANLCGLTTGVCNCTLPFVDIKCNSCRDRYYDTDPPNVLCEYCPCHWNGSNSDFCPNAICSCHPGYHGNSCNNCTSDFHVTEGVRLNDPICSNCSCHLDGSINHSCTDYDGNCSCLMGYEGLKCQKCIHSFFAINGTDFINPICQNCSCNLIGSHHDECTDGSGVCSCTTYYTGDKCETCQPNAYVVNGTDFETPFCDDCNCWPMGSNHLECSDYLGNCSCRPDYNGTKCRSCKLASYLVSGTEGDDPVCNSCFCHPNGSQFLQCDDITGICHCLLGYNDTKCNDCIFDYYAASGIRKTNAICEYCNCNPVTPKGCTDEGNCTCPVEYTGQKCKYCSLNHYVVNGTAGTDPYCTHCQCIEERAHHGECTDYQGECFCLVGYMGDKCQYFDCHGISSNNESVCSGHGTCVGINVCECEGEWQGNKCQLPVVQDYSCNAHDIALKSHMTSFISQDTTCFSIQEVDPQSCTLQGTCLGNNTCNCQENLYGPNCTMSSSNFAQLVKLAGQHAFNYSGDMMFDDCFNMFMLPSNSPQILRIHPDYSFVSTFGHPTEYGNHLDKGLYARFSSFRAITHNNYGHLILSDDVATLKYINTHNLSVSHFGGSYDNSIVKNGPVENATFTSINCLETDKYGRIFICDQHGIRMLVDLTIETAFGDPLVPINFTNIQELVYSERKHVLYSIEENSNRICVIDLNSNAIRTLFHVDTGYADGDFNTSRLHYPKFLKYALLEDALYFWDSNNHVIRKIDLYAETVTTVYGLAGSSPATSFSSTISPLSLAIPEIQSFLVLPKYEQFLMKSIGTDQSIYVRHHGMSFYVSGFTNTGEHFFSVVEKSKEEVSERCYGIQKTNPNVCSGHGSCILSNSIPHCVCDEDYEGVECERFAACQKFSIHQFGGAGAGLQNGNSNSSLFRRPVGLAIDGNQFLFVSDKNNHQIRKVSLTRSNVSHFAGINFGNSSGTVNNTQYGFPHGIYNFQNEYFFTVDSFYGQLKISRIQQNDVIIPYIGQLRNPSFVTLFDKNQMLFALSDTGNHRVLFINCQNLPSSCYAAWEVGTGEPGFGTKTFNSPTGIATYKNELLIADTGNAAIRKANNAGGMSYYLGSPLHKEIRDGNSPYFANPTAISVYEDMAYIIDGPYIRKLNLINHTVITIFPTIVNRPKLSKKTLFYNNMHGDDNPLQNFRLLEPSDILVTRNIMYITDSKLNSVFQIKLEMKESCSCAEWGFHKHDSCLCSNETYGEKCEFVSFKCGNVSNVDMHVCSKHGKCVIPEYCECFEGYTGDLCENFYCDKSVALSGTTLGTGSGNKYIYPLVFNSYIKLSSFFSINGILVADGHTIRYMEFPNGLTTFINSPSTTTLKSYLYVGNTGVPDTSFRPLSNVTGYGLGTIVTMVKCNQRIYFCDDDFGPNGSIFKIENDQIKRLRNLNCPAQFACTSDLEVFFTRSALIQYNAGTNMVSNLGHSEYGHGHLAFYNGELWIGKGNLLMNHATGLKIGQNPLITDGYYMYAQFSNIEYLTSAENYGLIVLDDGYIRYLNLDSMVVDTLDYLLTSVNDMLFFNNTIFIAQTNNELRFIPFMKKDECKCLNWTYADECQTCEFGYENRYCNQTYPIHECYGILNVDSSVCSGHGKCVSENACECEENYYGSRCNLPICHGIKTQFPSVCSGHGKCVKNDTCECEEGFSDPYCLLCPKGTEIDNSIRLCKACPEGSYNEEVGGKCKLCPPHSYTDSFGLTECIPCPAGTAHIPPRTGETSSFHCSRCGVGEYSGVAGSCHKCPAGTYITKQDGRLEDCLPCPKGTFSSVVGAISNSTCSPCPIFTYGPLSANPKLENCISCVNGDYMISNAQGLTEYDHLCRPCPAGTASETPLFGFSSCKACQPGFYSPIQRSTECTPCAIDYYNEYSNQTSCRPCPLGSGTAGPATRSADSCKVCPFGTYSLGNGCEKCPRGSASNVYNATSIFACKTCAEGHYADEVGTVTCKECPAGSYVTADRKECILCPFGYYNPVKNQEKCLPCDIGFYSERGSVSCTKCPIGTRTLERGDSSSCIHCPVFEYPINGENCSRCEYGQYLSLDYSMCKSCPKGTYSDTEIQGISQCKACPVGSYSNLVKSNSISNCIHCPSGFFGFKEAQTNSSACIRCPPGTYQNETMGQFISSCTLCPIGYYSPSYGAVSCMKCPNKNSCPSLGSTSITPLITLYKSYINGSVGIVGQQSIFSSPIINIFNPLYAQNEAFTVTNLILTYGSTSTFFVILFCLVSAVVFLALCIYGRRRSANLIRSFDICYSLQHEVLLHKNQVKRKSVIGGLLSIVSMAVIIILVIIIFSQLYFDNIFLLKSFRPKTSLPPNFVAEENYGVYEFSLRTPNELDHCSSIDYFKVAGIEPRVDQSTNNPVGFQTFHCTNENNITFNGENYMLPGCKCVYKCSDCRINSIHQKVSLFVPHYQASTFIYQASFPHYVANQQYVINGTLNSNSETVFYGDEPTTLFITVYDTLYVTQPPFLAPIRDALREFFYQDSAPDRILSGKQAEVIATSLSSNMATNTKQINTFSSEDNSGIHLEFDMSTSDFVFYIEENLKQTFLSALAQLASLSAMILWIGGFALIFFNRVYIQIDTAVKNRKKAKREKETTRPEWLQEEEYDDNQFMKIESHVFHLADSNATEDISMEKKKPLFTIDTTQKKGASSSRTPRTPSKVDFQSTNNSETDDLSEFADSSQGSHAPLQQPTIQPPNSPDRPAFITSNPVYDDDYEANISLEFSSTDDEDDFDLPPGNILINS